jgi:membrane associated rhomboid family serine protease
MVSVILRKKNQNHFSKRKQKKMPDGIPVVTVCLSVVLVCVYLAYYFKAWAKIPCGNDFLSIVASQFVHISLLHLAANLFSLWYMAMIERRLGIVKFLALVVSITLLSSIIDTLIGKRRCSIGFSGVLFGLFAWSVLTMPGFKWYNLGLVAVMLLANTGPNISLRGHAIGAISGVILGVGYRLFTGKK